MIGKPRNILGMNFKRISLICFIFSGLYLIGFIIYPDFGWDNYFNQPLTNILFDIFSTLLLSFCLVELYLRIDLKMNQVLPWNHQPIKRWIIQSGVQILALLLFLSLFAIFTLFIMDLLNIEVESVHSTENDLYLYILAIIALTLIVSMLNTVAFLSSKWKNEILTSAEHKKKEAEVKQVLAQKELQALRVQLDPHFVFNNLSVLSELILKNQQTGFEYSENLAKVYRYLLVTAEKQLITLGDEVKFLNSYLYLLQSRMGNGMNFSINICETKLGLNLPPMTLQLLVENVVKHNRSDKDKPLKIEIYTNNFDELVIENQVRPLYKRPPSSGIGLANIFHRYALLSDRKPQIIQNMRVFKVIIPLLK